MSNNPYGTFALITIFPIKGEPSGYVRLARSYDRTGVRSTSNCDVYTDLFWEVDKAEQFKKEVLKPLEVLAEWAY